MLEPTDERQLLAALGSGDRRAAEALVDRTYRQVFASLCRLTGGDDDLAADLTQETYRRAWKSLASFDRRAQFSTWLYRIAYNTFLNHLRRPRPLPLPEAEDGPQREPAELDREQEQEGGPGE